MADSDALDRLRAFNATLTKSTSAMRQDMAELDTDLLDLGKLQSGWDGLVDEHSSGGFALTLQEIDTILDKAVDAAVTALTDASTSSSDAETEKLTPANERSDAEAAAFESLAAESATSVREAVTQLRLDAVALADQAVWAGVALGRLESAATKALATVNETVTSVVADLAEKMKGVAEEASESATDLEPSVQELKGALDPFTEGMNAASGELAKTHAALASGLATSYEAWGTSADETAESTRKTLEQHLAGHGELLKTYGQGLGTDEGAQALDAALKRVGAERDAWGERIEERADLVSTLPDTQTNLLTAQAIAEKAVAVADAVQGA